MKKVESIKKLIFICVLVFIVTLSSKCYAAESQNINAIDYDIQMNKDGSAIVSEIWDMEINPEIGIIEKEFEDGIKVTGVEVSEYDSNGNEKIKYTCVDGNLKENEFANIKSSEGKNVIKIKPTIPADCKMYFLITYKLENIYKKYNDCTEINICLQNNKFNFNSHEISGRIKFENTVEENDFKAWLTSKEKSEVSMREDSIIYFSTDKNEANEILSLRVVLLNNAIEASEENKIDEDKLTSIIEEENAKIDAKKEQEKLDMIFDIIIVGMVIVIIVIIIIIVTIISLKRIKAKKIEKRIDQLDDLEDVKKENQKEEIKENKVE